MTPIVNNQTATTIVPVITSSDHNSHDSAHYKDLMEKYKIDEQYAKTKSDKAKSQKLYQYSHQRYLQERHDEKMAITIGVSVVVIIIIVLVLLTIFA